MKWEVKLYVGGKVFTEEVYASSHRDARETATARNPRAKVIESTQLSEVNVMNSIKYRPLKIKEAIKLISQTGATITPGGKHLKETFITGKNIYSSPWW